MQRLKCSEHTYWIYHLTAYTSTVNPAPAAHCMFSNIRDWNLVLYINTSPFQSVERLTEYTASFVPVSTAIAFYPACILSCQSIFLWAELKIINQILPRFITSTPTNSLSDQTRREWENSRNECIRKAINLLSPLYWLSLSTRWNLVGLIDFCIFHSYLNFSFKNNG